MSTPINLQNIPKKFYPSIINRSDFKDKSLKQRVEHAFSWGVPRLHPLANKTNIFTAPALLGYVLKRDRIDQVGQAIGQTCALLGRPNDILLYRVRKALKIERLIEKYGFEEVAQVPKKYLYFHESAQRWYVIAEKLELSDALPKLPEDYVRDCRAYYHSEEFGDGIPLVMHELINDKRKPRQEVSPEQARLLAILAAEAGLTDLTALNTVFTQDGKIAILDTEPVRRVRHKQMGQSNFIYKLVIGFFAFKTWELLLSTAKLRFSLSDPKAVEAVKSVENYYLAIHAVKTIATTLFIVVAWSYAGAIPIMLVPFILKTALVLKALFTLIETIGTVNIANLSRNGGYNGLLKLSTMEQKGQL